MALDIALDDFTDDEIEKKASASGLIPKGKYLAMLVEATEPEEYKGKLRTKLQFEIIDGQYKDRKVFHDLWHASDKGDETTRTMKELLVYWGKRLGLFAKTADGKITYCNGKTDFPDCVPSDEVYVDVITETYDGKERNKLSMYGIKSVQEHLDEEKARAEKGTKKGRGNSGSTATTAATNGGSPGTPHASPPPSVGKSVDKMDDV